MGFRAEMSIEQTIEGGIDALEVIRDVHLFVSEYSYDFHSQCYVERAKNGFGIQHVSARYEHGIGFLFGDQFRA